MLSLEELPRQILDVYGRTREIAGDIYQVLEGVGEPASLPAGSDLLASGSAAYAYVQKGCLKLFEGDRLVRLYNDGDFVCCERTPESSDFRLESPFATNITVYAREQLCQEFRRWPEVEHLWMLYSDLERWLMLLLCAHHMGEDAQPDFRLQHFNYGDVLLSEGQSSDEIYTLIEGAASVTVNDVEVGVVKAGEIFGEMGFLTEQPCVATVTATQPGLLQSVKKDCFQRLVRCRPEMMVDLCTTLAKRLAALDQKISASRG